jgi:hypothetical protein
MIACAATHIALVALLIVLTAVAATQRSVTARKKKQAKDELAPVLGAFDLGISFTRGVVGVGAGITNATRVAGPNGFNGPSGSNGPNGPLGSSGPSGQSGKMVPVPYTPRQIKADAGQTTFCVEGVPEAVRARLSKFTSIVGATARVTSMLVDEMCNSGELRTMIEAIKKGLSGASCHGAIEAMRESASAASSSTASSASTNAVSMALVALVEAIADATCSATHTIDGAKLGLILDGVGDALCSPVDQNSGCAGIVVRSKPTDGAYAAQLVRALAAAVRTSAVASARSKCNMMITSVRGMDKEFDAIAAVVRASEITRGCAMIKSALEARSEMGDTESLVSVVRASLVAALCAHSDALASMSPADLKELVIDTIQAMCSVA